MEGPTLAELLEERGPWPAEQVEQFLHTMLGHLSHLHALGIVHGQIGPETIRYTPDGRCVLVDIWTARRNGHPVGDVRGDLHALGTTACTLLTGEAIRDGTLPPLPSEASDGLRGTLQLLLKPEGAPSATQALRVLSASRLTLLLSVLALAAIPPALVVLDRWLNLRPFQRQLQEPWCQVDLLCQLAWPPYFVIVVACLLAVPVVLVLFDRMQLQVARPLPPPARPVLPGAGARVAGTTLLVGAAALVVVSLAVRLISQSLPGFEWLLALLLVVAGWLLRETPPAAVQRLWERRDRLLAAALLHVALVGVLAAAGTGSSLLPLAGVLLLLAVGLVLERRAGSPALWLSALGLTLFSLNAGSWMYAIIGDEYSFYYRAHDILKREGLATLGANLFDGTAVYGSHPYFSSLLHAASLALIGDTSSGWRFSNIYLAALSAVLLYSFFRRYTQPPVALAAGIMLVSSSYLMNFAKIGYNNLQALLALAVVLHAAGWASRSRRAGAYALLGLALGLCLYVYPAALYVLPVGGLLVALYDPPFTLGALRRYGLALLHVGLLLTPLLLQPDYWSSKIAGTTLITPEILETRGRAAFHYGSNLLYSLTSFLYIPDETHFVNVGYTDALSAVFIPIGAIVLLRQVRRDRFALFLVGSFITLIIAVGMTHDRPTPPNTRMFLVLPWFALFAAVGLLWTMAQLRARGMPARTQRWLLGIVLALVVGANLYQAYGLMAPRQARYQPIQSLVLRIAQQHLSPPAPEPARRLVFVNDPARLYVDSLRELVTLYQVPYVPDQMVEIIATEQTPETADRAALDDPRAMVVITPELAPERAAPFVAHLEATGRVACAVRATNGDVRLVMYISAGMPQLCDLR